MMPVLTEVNPNRKVSVKSKKHIQNARAVVKWEKSVVQIFMGLELKHQILILSCAVSHDPVERERQGTVPWTAQSVVNASDEQVHTHTHTHTYTHTHTHTYTLAHTHSLSLTHTLTK